MVGREIARLATIPGDPQKLIKILKDLKNIENVTATDHGVVVEGADIASRLPEISKALDKGKETVVEMSLSRPSLEDVFLKLTGSKLREVGKVEPAKRN